MKSIKIGSIALIAAVIAAITFSMDSFAKKRIKQSAQKAINAGSKDIAAPTAVVVKIAPEVPSDTVVVDQKEFITKATAETQLIEDNAMGEMNKARQQLIEGKINPAEALKIIGEQNTTIAQAKQELKRKIAKSVEAVEASDAQQGYFAYFMSGAKNLGQKALAPFQAGYGYTQEEKELAEQVIKGLIKQKEQITADYDRAKEKASDITKSNELRERYDAIISELNNEIYQQQLITGEAMSTERKLFWAAVVAGGAVAGLAALSSLGEDIATPQEPILVPTKVETTIEQSILPVDIDTTPISIPMSSPVSPEPNVVAEDMAFGQTPTPTIPEEPEEQLNPAVDVEDIKIEEPANVVISAEQDNQPAQDVKPETESTISEEIMTPEKESEETLLAEDTLTPEQTETTDQSDSSAPDSEGGFSGAEELPITLSAETNIAETPEEPQLGSEEMAQGDQEVVSGGPAMERDQSINDMENEFPVAEESSMTPSGETNIAETPEAPQLDSEGMAPSDQEIASEEPTKELDQSTNDMENEFPVAEESSMTPSGETNIAETPEAPQLDSEGMAPSDQEIASEEPTKELDQSTNDMENEFPVAEESLMTPSGETNIAETPEAPQLDSEGMAPSDQEIASEEPTKELDQSTNGIENEFPVAEESSMTPSGETNIAETAEAPQLDSEGMIPSDQEIASEEPTDQSNDDAQEDEQKLDEELLKSDDESEFPESIEI